MKDFLLRLKRISNQEFFCNGFKYFDNAIIYVGNGIILEKDFINYSFPIKERSEPFQIRFRISLNKEEDLNKSNFKCYMTNINDVLFYNIESKLFIKNNLSKILLNMCNEKGINCKNNDTIEVYYRIDQNTNQKIREFICLRKIHKDNIIFEHEDFLFDEAAAKLLTGIKDISNINKINIKLSLEQNCGLKRKMEHQHSERLNLIFFEDIEYGAICDYNFKCLDGNGFSENIMEMHYEQTREILDFFISDVFFETECEYVNKLEG